MKSPNSNHPLWSKGMLAVEIISMLLLALSFFVVSILLNPESSVQMQSSSPLNLSHLPVSAQLTTHQTTQPKPPLVTNEALSDHLPKDKKRIADPWQVLIHQLDIPTAGLQKAAPHFPERFSLNFTKERIHWTQRYPAEVKAILAIPAIQALNPSHIALGIQGLIPRDEIYNPFWYMYRSSKDRKAKIDAVAPHFPQPDRSLTIEEQERQYKVDFRNWAKKYPREFDGFRELTMN